MGLYRYSNENKCYENVEYEKDEKKEDKWENKKEDECEDKKEDHCDKESAKALKRILSLLDDLNNQDLRLLDDIIDRLLCIRSKVY